MMCSLSCCAMTNCSGAMMNGGEGGREEKVCGACPQAFRPVLLRVAVAGGAAAASVRGRCRRTATAASLAAAGPDASGGAGPPAQVAPHAEARRQCRRSAGNAGGLPRPSGCGAPGLKSKAYLVILRGYIYINTDAEQRQRHQ